MTGPEHYRDADAIITAWENGNLDEERITETLAGALVHAVLALTMATALGEQETEYKDWLRVNMGSDLR